jgi:hypothetical protein
MSSREELEQDLQIVEAELEDAKRRIFDLQTELDVARGANIRVTEAAREAGVELAVAKTPAEAALMEVADARKGLADEIQAIAELHAPSAQPEAAMSTLDHVRAANQKTHELGKRLAAANTIVSRIAAIVGVTTWDAEGTELRAVVQQYAHLGFLTSKKQTAVAREAKDPTLSATERAEFTGWTRALAWIREQLYAGAKPDADAETPLSAPDGLFREQSDGTESRVRRFVGGDAGDVEVLICRGDSVVRRTVVSSLQLSTADYWQRAGGPLESGTAELADQPYRK